jgi:hypothetical protein
MTLDGFAYLSVRRDGIYVRANASRDFAHTHDLISFPVRVTGQLQGHSHRCKRVISPKAAGPVHVGQTVELLLELQPC